MTRGFSSSAGANVEVLDAARPGLDRGQMAALATSRHRIVRETIARRDDVPVGIQAALAQDDAMHVRAAIAANPATVNAVLDHLAADRNKDVVKALLTNRSLPFALVERLAQHRRREVRAAAQARHGDVAPMPRPTQWRVEDAIFPELRERATIASGQTLTSVS
ncbi:hypothetical protein LGT39_08860 [Demequina sp. TTPB684]|uniref:variant leucine-rich repeat-containing protein n=1 Tax=unclassified Demequina TaxID=2620311 RepID=UPI001CF0E376|nr:MULTISPECIES: hypothetical protein [unclassified Demequina]MCB2412955.1 hypothetical protein [Demequina sp. TTPB684]UPU88418.1 hypothetical protein LGT36_000385 [Demequina sp. TMPB413]